MAEQFFSFPMKILTHKTTLIPSGEFVPEEAARYLELCGMRCTSSECAVWSKPVGGAVAVMAVNRLKLEQLPANETFTSPLLEGPEMPSSPTLWVASYEGLLYIKVYDPKLVLAEVLPMENREDLLYYIATLAERLPLRQYHLVVEGERSAGVRKILKSQFK